MAEHRGLLEALLLSLFLIIAVFLYFFPLDQPGQSALTPENLRKSEEIELPDLSVNRKDDTSERPAQVTFNITPGPTTMLGNTSNNTSIELAPEETGIAHTEKITNDDFFKALILLSVMNSFDSKSNSPPKIRESISSSTETPDSDVMDASTYNGTTTGRSTDSEIVQKDNNDDFLKALVFLTFMNSLNSSSNLPSKTPESVSPIESHNFDNSEKPTNDESMEPVIESNTKGPKNNNDDFVKALIFLSVMNSFNSNSSTTSTIPEPTSSVGHQNTDNSSVSLNNGTIDRAPEATEIKQNDDNFAKSLFLLSFLNSFNSSSKPPMTPKPVSPIESQNLENGDTPANNNANMEQVTENNTTVSKDNSDDFIKALIFLSVMNSFNSNSSTILKIPEPTSSVGIQNFTN